MSSRVLLPLVAFVVLAPVGPVAAQTDPASPAPLERVTFEEAVKRAIERNPTVRQAAQAILRAQAILDEAKSVFRPSLYGNVSNTILDAARGFNGTITQPRVQSVFNAKLSYAFLAATRWAEKNQAADQVSI